MLEFKILGPLEVLENGTPIPLGGRNQRAVLTLLLLRANEAVSADRLIDQLWGEHPPRTATTSLQNAISQLRKLLGPGVLHTRPTGYLLDLEGKEFDLARFEQLVGEAHSAEPELRAAILREALALWRGSALADVALETFAQEDARRLEELRLGALEERIAADLEAGADAALVPELEGLVAAHPLRERFRSQLMLALYRSGRQADALEAYGAARRTLVEELGLEPGPELQSLYGSILRQERALVVTPPPPLDDHFDEVLRALLTGRLVPVLGPGACSLGGLELAELLEERFDLPGNGRGLAYLCQAVAARNGIGPLYDELHLALCAEREPGPLARWLASMPRLLRQLQLPQLLIVTTAIDACVERAFAEVEEELDVVAYIASGRSRGRFVHLPPDGEPVVVDEPNAYAGLALERRPALLKIHGHLDVGESRERDSFVVSEDDHIDYLAGSDVTAILPVQLAARLRRSHLLFLGYEVEDWSLRVFLRRVWSGDRLAYRSWAVQPRPDPVARELWRERGAEVYDVSLDVYAESLARLTASLEPEEVA